MKCVKCKNEAVEGKTRCEKCASIQAKANLRWQRANPEKYREYVSKWQKANREKGLCMCGKSRRPSAASCWRCTLVLHTIRVFGSSRNLEERLGCTVDEAVRRIEARARERYPLYPEPGVKYDIHHLKPISCLDADDPQAQAEVGREANIVLLTEEDHKEAHRLAVCR